MKKQLSSALPTRLSLLTHSYKVGCIFRMVMSSSYILLLSPCPKIFVQFRALTSILFRICIGRIIKFDWRFKRISKERWITLKGFDGIRFVYEWILTISSKFLKRNSIYSLTKIWWHLNWAEFLWINAIFSFELSWYFGLTVIDRDYRL